MGYKRPHINTKGKPYKCVGWRKGKNGFGPIFVPKTEKELEREGMALADKTTMRNLASDPKMMEMLETSPLVSQIEPVMFTSGMIPGADRMRNACSEIDLRGRTPQTLDGHLLYDGKNVQITVDEDGDMLVKQHDARPTDMVRFGPLSSSLKQLMDEDHYWLETRITRRQRASFCTRPIRVYLTNGIDRYKLFSTDWRDMQTDGKTLGRYDLTARMPDKMNLLKTHSSVHTPAPQVVERLVEKTVEVIKERDPFEVLAERYPRKKGPKLTMDTLVGNRTLGERLGDWTS